MTVLGRTDLFDQTVERIRTESDLREMAANPFLLGLLVRVLARAAGQGTKLRTLADVYRQVTSWIQELHNLTPPVNDPLTIEHLAALRRLSHGLLFDADLPRYLFHAQELAEGLGGCSVESVCRSRFINRADPVFDEYTFLHATFQEYFAAEHGAAMATAELDRFLERSFYSLSRMTVLDFAAGLRNQVATRCRERVTKWFQRRDRFHQILLRVARVAAAGRWPAADGDHFGQGLREALWAEIRSNQDMTLTNALVDVFAELDAEDLSRCARIAKGLDFWIIQCIVDAVPASVGRREQLDDLLTGAWRDYAGFDARGGVTEEDLKAIRAALVNPALDRGDRRTAVIHAGVARDLGCLPGLLTLLTQEESDHDLQGQVIDSLGSIGGREAIDKLVSIVIGEHICVAENQTMAGNVLSHAIGQRKLLDPGGRDRLLCRLAALPPDDPSLENILTALASCPLRDGCELIEHLVRHTEGAPQCESPPCVRLPQQQTGDCSSDWSQRSRPSR